ncbi:hypothetical protein DXT99_11915 [Pontibacter diazotrophicus]|uniref:DUF4175 domain-containing protein n=1 Tax=Pontibacter diazotrophicus TaxID=1400979 RepID=A0A3D8LCB0_9BACT|nr:hypothetical protein [Pontibacter diazotrophicus]RDV14983.1 hypothetical protein DXT99_11915 [Pontibacter diazotrophicus]
MSTASIIAVILIALIIAAIFYYGLNSRGPWGSFWTFVLVVGFGVLIAAVWARPVGPVWYGIAWFPLLFIGLLFALLLAAATPTTRRTDYPTRRTGYVEEDPRMNEPITEEGNAAEDAVAVGILFWTMLTLFLLIVVLGIIF